MQRAEPLHDRFAILVAIRLKVRTLWQEVANVEPAVGPHGANVLDRFVAAIACCEDRVARLAGAEDIAALHRLRNRDSCGGERRWGHINLLDKVLAHGAFRNARPTYNERNVSSLVIQKLLAA